MNTLDQQIEELEANIAARQAELGEVPQGMLDELAALKEAKGESA